MPVDTSVQNTTSTDTAGYINTQSGKFPLDTNVVSKTTKAPVKKNTKKVSGKTPRHDPNGKDTTRF
jgi:molybdopterin-guanine dinucleotide biosynthesis protein